MTSTAAPSPSSILFARGVIARLAIWPTLKIAVQEGWGGSNGAQKQSWIASVIVDAFEDDSNQKPDDVYIEELLLQIMADEFDAMVEDESAEKVSQDIVLLWDETRVGKQDSVLKFEELAAKLKGKRVDAHFAPPGEDDEWEDEDVSDDDEEAPQLIQPAVERPPRNEPEIDEEGFTLVKGRGKGRR
ncbi:hypothetical protein DXG03_005236 [Asterophora parasitica]|uniref:Pre-rRNA-processing protein TSR2 n=1 Tax=Asterophora parasitica TaxID=117018 RepID=A0A9P7FZL8_9AGAR|nr:hypothetical protein DXG03_005236 [Asterophora parasitica]